jgi:hypothetical protein
MSIVQIPFDELFISKEYIKLNNQKINDIQKLKSSWNTIEIEWKNIISSIPIDCKDKICQKSIKNIQSYFIDYFNKKCKDNYYLLTIIDSLNDLNLNVKSISEINLQLNKWKIHIQKLINEEINTLSNLQNNENINSSYEEQLQSFITFLKNCNNNKSSQIVDNILNNLKNKYCNNNIQCKQYILLLINKKDTIIASCILNDYYFKNNLHLSYFCGDNQQLVTQYLITNKNKQSNITVELSFTYDTFINCLDLCVLNFIMKYIKNDETITITYEYKNKNNINTKSIHYCQEIFKTFISFHKSIDPLYICLFPYQMILNCKEFSYYIQPLLNIIYKNLCYPLNSSNMTVKFYISNQIANINKTNSFSNILFLLLQNKILFKCLIQNLTSSTKIKIIQSLDINSNNELLNTIILEEINSFPSIESKKLYYTDSFNILNIPKYNTKLFDIITSSKIYSTNINIVKNSCGEESINLIPIKNLESKDITNLLKNEHSNLILSSETCNAKIIFPCYLLYKLPNNYDTQYFQLKNIGINNEGQHLIQTFIHSESNTLINSEILYMKSYENLPSIDIFIKCITTIINSDIKIICIASKYTYIFLQLTTEFINSLHKNTDLNNTIFIDSLQKLLSINLFNNDNELNSLKNIDISDTILESTLNLFINKCNNIEYNHTIIMKCKGYTRNDILSLENIEYEYNEKNNTCFPNTVLTKYEEIKEEEIKNNFYTLNYFDEIGPFYQLDERDLHHKNTYNDIYDEDNRDDEVEEYRGIDYEHTLLLEEFNRYGYPPEEYDIQLKIDLNKDEYFKTIQEEEDYRYFTQEQENIDIPSESLINETEENSNELAELKELNKISNKNDIHLFKDVSSSPLKINSNIDEQDIEDYMIKSNQIKYNVNKEQLQVDKRRMKYDYIFNDNIQNQNNTIEMQQAAKADLENPLERKYKQFY